MARLENLILFGILLLAYVSSSKAIFLKPDDTKVHESLGVNIDADLYDWENHPCRRACKDNEPPRLCRYNFNIENYMAMNKACYDCPYNITDCFRKQCITIDGNQRQVIAVNRQLPGPPVEVCHGDTIYVDLRNRMLAESTTIHWHGINQVETPYMDGVPFVTQCPIVTNQRFIYKFEATEPGTHFWHSHFGGQRGDGLFGPLIVHQREKNNPHRNLYDFDHHSMMLIDWKSKTTQAESILIFKHTNPNFGPDTILINGKGRFQEFRDNKGKIIYTPDAIFKVKKNYRYRFRFVNAGAENCPMEMAIDGHSMTIISTDSHDIEPVEVDVLHSWPGERYDFIINANKKVDNYWIRFRGNGKFCNKPDLNFRVHQVSILRYEGADEVDPKAPIDPSIPVIIPGKTRVLNPYDTGSEAKDAISLSQLVTLEPDDPAVLQEKPDKTFFLDLDFYRIDNHDYQRQGLFGYNDVRETTRSATFQFNRLSYHPPTFPFLTQREDVLPSSYCNSSNFHDEVCKTTQCTCPHVIHADLNDVVELVIIDRGEFDITNHPMHLHGHAFRVLATENLEGIVNNERFKKLDKQGLIKRNFRKAVVKDTVKVPSGGYTVVRFYANNPGYWFFHCHFEQHVELGLALTFKIGEHDQMVPTPETFPTCGRTYEPR